MLNSSASSLHLKPENLRGIFFGRDNFSQKIDEKLRRSFSRELLAFQFLNNNGRIEYWTHLIKPEALRRVFIIRRETPQVLELLECQVPVKLNDGDGIVFITNPLNKPNLHTLEERVGQGLVVDNKVYQIQYTSGTNEAVIQPIDILSKEFINRFPGRKVVPITSAPSIRAYNQIKKKPIPIGLHTFGRNEGARFFIEVKKQDDSLCPIVTIKKGLKYGGQILVYSKSKETYEELKEEDPLELTSDSLICFCNSSLGERTLSQIYNNPTYRNFYQLLDKTYGLEIDQQGNVNLVEETTEKWFRIHKEQDSFRKTGTY